MFMPSKAIGRVWIPNKVIDDMVIEAERVAPLETGGAFMGYWVVPNIEVVITKQIGPGPKAKHRRYSFEPDSEWQEAEIAKIYRESGYRHTYLGDWHTHPCGNPALSWKDLRVMRKIGLSKKARVAIPLMGIVAGGSPWLLNIWSGNTIKNKAWSFIPKTEVLEIQVYE
jgi:integrative and conjugative element protein (TIGR02256 family)